MAALCAVDHGSAADGDQAVATLAAEVLQTRLDAGEGWVLGHPVVEGAGHPRGEQCVLQGSRQLQLHQRSVGHQQRMAPAPAAELVGQLPAAAGTDQEL